VLQALFHRLSPDDVYTRFFRRVRSLSFAEVQTLCNVNHESGGGGKFLFLSYRAARSGNSIGLSAIAASILPSTLIACSKRSTLPVRPSA
jgi:hypothetical protein